MTADGRDWKAIERWLVVLIALHSAGVGTILAFFEGGRLPGAGLGAPEEVLPLEHEGDRLFLDGCRGGVLLLRDGAEDLGPEPEGLKRRSF